MIDIEGMKRICLLKQKTADEVSACLVGSEMCVRVSGEALNTDRKLVILNAFSMLEAAASERAGA